MNGKRTNRCSKCGRFVGDRFAGYERDRASGRGRLICEPCFAVNEQKEADDGDQESI